MLKMLKADFYRLIKSKMLLALFIVTLCTVFIEVLLLYVPYGSPESVYNRLYGFTNSLSLFMWIFVVPFAAKDFSSKYTKNLVPTYSVANRIYYILSKVFYIFVYCVLFLLLRFVIFVIFNYAFGPKCMYEMPIDNGYYTYGDQFTIKQFWLNYFWQLLHSVAMGAFMLFLCVLVKKEYIVMIIYLPLYFFISPRFCDIIHSIVKHDFAIEKYTLIGICNWFGDCSVKDYGIIYAMAAIYLVLFTVGSCLLFARKSLIKKETFDGKTLIKTNDIKKSFRKKCVLSDVNLEITKGEMYGLVGNNGAGKTTLLKMFCNLLRPTEGSITLNSQAFSSRVPIGTLIESPALYFDMTAFQNIKAKAIALNVKYSKKDIYDLLEIVGLQDTGKKDVRAFSMGMKQRLGIAMALVGDPDLLILDEPINGLDPQGIIEVRSLLERLHRERNVTMVISSHILDELAKTATRFCVINRGEIIKNCTKEQFMAECGDKDIAEYYLQLIQSN